MNRPNTTPALSAPRARTATALLALATCVLTAGVVTGQERRQNDTDPLLITKAMRQAVERGHAFLAENQHPDGYWSQHVGFKLNQDYRITEADAAHVGVTSLALMSFLAGGHLPGRGKYGENIERGLDYVLGCVRENGYITDAGSRMYSHAFATLFLAEIYGMTRRNDVRRALQDAVNIIVDSQNAEGGWRYKPFARESDMSITVCQVLALRSARNVGITVSARTIRDAENYVRRSAVTGTRQRRSRAFRNIGYVNEGGAFRYQLRTHSRATFALTAAGITTMYAAGTYDDILIDSAFEYLEEQLPIFNTAYAGHYFFYYGHYYAVQAFYVAGGDLWTNYFRRMRDTLVSMQDPISGSWPNEPGPGEAFSTAVATLILQIPYQYLPIFQR